jgi:heme/copper-type cytochrome/quinol oxidase subunit 4
MSAAGFKPAIVASGLPQTYVLYRVANVKLYGQYFLTFAKKDVFVHLISFMTLEKERPTRIG